MANSAPAGQPATSTKVRYLTAILTVILFVFVLFSLDALVSHIIFTYFPGFDRYITYAWEGSNALVGVIGAYIIYKILMSVISLREARKRDHASSEVARLILRVVFSFIGISIVLTAFGVSLAGALTGGAIGGVIIGLAAQTIVTSILSGFLVSSSRTLAPGDLVILKSSSWGSYDILAKITRVNTLYAEGLTTNGNVIRFPNPLLLTATILTHLKHTDGSYTYPLQVTANSDVPSARLRASAQAAIGRKFKELGLKNPDIVFVSMAGSTMSFNVLIYFGDISQINGLSTIVNDAFNNAYWNLKKK